MASVSIDVKPPNYSKHPEVAPKSSAEQKKVNPELDFIENGQSKDSTCQNEVNSVLCDDDSLFSLILDHLKSWLRFTLESVASKPGGQLVLRTTDSLLEVAERVVFWIQDSKSLGWVPWLVMLPFLISVRIANSFLSLTERITGLPMPTQARVYSTIRTWRNDIWDIRKIGMKKEVEIDTEDKQMDNEPRFNEEKIQMLNILDEKHVSSDEEEGACAIVEDTYSQISDDAYNYSSTIESSDCDSELGHKIESIMSTISTTLDESFTSF